MESDGAGEIVFCQRGLMQDPAQLQGQQEMRQQTVLDGCGGAKEESWDASMGTTEMEAAAGERPLMMFPNINELVFEASFTSVGMDTVIPVFCVLQCQRFSLVRHPERCGHDQDCYYAISGTSAWLMRK